MFVVYCWCNKGVHKGVQLLAKEMDIKF